MLYCQYIKWDIDSIESSNVSIAHVQKSASEFRDLPGCVTGGRDLAEALEMAVDVASGWVLDELEAAVLTKVFY